MNRNKIRTAYKTRVMYFEKKYTPVMRKAIQSQVKLVEQVLLNGGVNAARRFNDSVLMNEQVGTAIRDLYKTVGLYFANDNYRNLNEQVKSKGFGFNLEWANELINYFRLYLLNKAVVPITETTKEFIRQILEEGELNGWGIDKMAYEMTHSDVTLNRARLIARTEIAKAAFKGRELGREKLPYFTQREWISAEDHRTRHSHRIVDGQKVEEGKKFLVPRYVKKGKIEFQNGWDVMSGPGDPQASKENVINCRCTTVDRIVFKNGEPVMKRNEAVF